MEDDLISGLTRQVKEEVMENYMTERRLVLLQIEDIEKLTEDLRFNAVKTGRRFNRLAGLMVDARMRDRLFEALGIDVSPFWISCCEGRFPRTTRFIKVRAITDKGKFRKLVIEAYARLYQWMDKYRKAYEDLRVEYRAVNSNISRFQKNFDLLSIISFLRSLDTHALERMNILGENFSAEERTSLDRKLHIKTVSFEGLDIPKPLELPEPARMEGRLNELANEVYRKYQEEVKKILE
jgi:hypothetical protein